MMAKSGNFVVADSTTRTPLPSVSVFDKNGTAIGCTDTRGLLPHIAADSYPITLRLLGFKEMAIDSIPSDTIFIVENATELPEVVVSSKQHKVLHLLGYVREYSTLTTYTDTVFLFREKMVDYMLTPDKKVKFNGWQSPRVLKCRSYYHFTNSTGLDSVSGEGEHHFSWSDWIGIEESPRMISGVRHAEIAADTIMGKYSPTEIWDRRDYKLTVEINVLADTTGRRWVPNMSGFFRNNLDFEIFKVRFNYDNVVGDTIHPTDLTGYSFSIESNGRGREMFRFNRLDQPFFVSTYCEVYILDKEYITIKEAKKWANRSLNLDEVEIFEPTDAPELQSHILALVERVENINKDEVRLNFVPDQRMVRKYPPRNNFSIGSRALSLLKGLTGITSFKSNRNLNDNWDTFRKKQLNRNNSRTDD